MGERKGGDATSRSKIRGSILDGQWVSIPVAFMDEEFNAQLAQTIENNM